MLLRRFAKRIKQFSTLAGPASSARTLVQGRRMTNPRDALPCAHNDCPAAHYYRFWTAAKMPRTSKICLQVVFNVFETCG
jgi:hypothetical protein